jgi:TonB family protein
MIIRGHRRNSRNPRGRVVRAVFERPAEGGALAVAYPGYGSEDDDDRRTWVTGSISTLIHLALFAALFIASLAPVIEEEIIPVRLLTEEPPPPPPEPAAAPKALAQRRSMNYAPAVQAVQPQIVNPNVVAQASPSVHAEALQMDAVSAVRAPTQVQRSTTVVEKVSAVNSVVRARAHSVDVARVAAPVVRGPVQVDAPAGPSVGPRVVQAAAVEPTVGTAPVQIGGNAGSSSPSGVLAAQDVIGSPDGIPTFSIDTEIGSGYLRGSGGAGTSVTSKSACFLQGEVQSYLGHVKDRTMERWVLPPGVKAGERVTLRFHIDVAGSASRVSLVDASDNALGASAVDALRAAAPFPPMPEDVRCLSQVPIVGTFTNPVGS